LADTVVAAAAAVEEAVEEKDVDASELIVRVVTG